MDPFTASLIVGTGVQLFGMHSAKKAQKRAARANAAAMRAQAAFNAMVARREGDIFKTESTIFLGSKQSAISKSGVDFTGSSLMSYATDKAAIARQYEAIKTGAAQRASMAEMQAAESSRQARDIGKVSDIQSIGAIINATGSYYNYQTRKNNNDRDILNDNRNSTDQIDNVYTFRSNGSIGVE